MKRQWRAAAIKNTLFFMGLIIVAIFLFHSESWAQNDSKIQPGKYEVTTKMRSSLDNALSKKTIERCIEGDTINPQSFLPDPERCNLTNLKKSGDMSSFNMECTSPDGLSLTGQMEYSVQKTSFSYKFHLKAPYNDGVFEIDSEGTAVRVGDC